jgi:hypothetical protein
MYLWIVHLETPALLHAAARCERVCLRGSCTLEFARGPGENRHAYYTRILQRRAGATKPRGPNAEDPPVLAFLFRGDVDLPAKSSVYALFRYNHVPSLTASDLIA